MKSNSRLAASLCLQLSGCVLLGMALSSCSTPDPRKDWVAEEWENTIEQYHIMPVYPPTEDIHVGDIYVVPNCDEVIDAAGKHQDRNCVREKKPPYVQTTKIGFIDPSKYLTDYYGQQYVFTTVPVETTQTGAAPAAPAAPGAAAKDPAADIKTAKSALDKSKKALDASAKTLAASEKAAPPVAGKINTAAAAHKKKYASYVAAFKKLVTAGQAAIDNAGKSGSPAVSDAFKTAQAQLKQDQGTLDAGATGLGTAVDAYAGSQTADNKSAMDDAVASGGKLADTATADAAKVLAAAPKAPASGGDGGNAGTNSDDGSAKPQKLMLANATGKDKDIFSPVGTPTTLPIAAFPGFNLYQKKEESAGIMVPLKALFVGGSVAHSSEEATSVQIGDVHTYGLDAHTAFGLLTLFCMPGQGDCRDGTVRSEALANLGFAGCLPPDIMMIKRVYVTTSITYVYGADSALGQQASLMLETASAVANQATAKKNEGSSSSGGASSPDSGAPPATDPATAAVNAMNATIQGINDRLNAQAAPGVNFSVVSVSGKGVTLREQFARPVVVGYSGVSMSAQVDGKGPAANAQACAPTPNQ